MDISNITRDLEAAVADVASRKSALIAAQEALDMAKKAHDDALASARDLHASLQAKMSEVIPGLKK